MSDGIEKPRAKMTRCPEGHIFDAAAYEACPTCGSKIAAAAAPQPPNRDSESGPVRRDDPAPQPSWLRPALIGGSAIVGILIIALLFRGEPPAETARVADANPIEAQTGALAVERWRTVMVIGGRSYDCVNETTSDGRYRLGPGCPPPFAGETGQTIVNADGSWTSRSDAGRSDAGTVEQISADKFIAHTRGGPVVWERVQP